MKMELATIMNAMLRPDDIVAINKRVQQKKVSGNFHCTACVNQCASVVCLLPKNPKMSSWLDTLGEESS